MVTTQAQLLDDRPLDPPSKKILHLCEHSGNKSLASQKGIVYPVDNRDANLALNTRSTLQPNLRSNEKHAYRGQFQKDDERLLRMQDDFEMTRGKEIVLGLLLMLGGLAAFLSNWYDAVSEGAFRHGGAILAPVLFVGGVMIIAAPYPYDDQPFKTELAPKTWKLFIFVGLVLGFANWYFMNFS